MTPEELLQTACGVVFWVGLLIFLVLSSLVVTGQFLGLVIFTVSLVATGRTEYFSASTAIQLGRKSMKTSPCVPDAALSGELVYVSCKLSGSKALGSGITGMRDLPEAERLGLSWQERGPPGPDAGGPTMWRGQRWRPQSRKWANRGGKHREAWAKYYANMRKRS